MRAWLLVLLWGEIGLKTTVGLGDFIHRRGCNYWTSTLLWKLFTWNDPGLLGLGLRLILRWFWLSAERWLVDNSCLSWDRLCFDFRTSSFAVSARGFSLTWARLCWLFGKLLKLSAQIHALQYSQVSGTLKVISTTQPSNKIKVVQVGMLSIFKKS